MGKDSRDEDSGKMNCRNMDSKKMDYGSMDCRKMSSKNVSGEKMSNGKMNSGSVSNKIADSTNTNNVSMGECTGLLRQRMCHLFWKIAEEKEDITIDGVKGYNEKAQFVGGKVINLCSYTALSFASDEAEQQRMLGVLGDIIAMCAEMKMETWGILNGLTGLYRLKETGVYQKVINPETEIRLKEAMDWHTFVDEENDYALIHKPTNYYGVAFGIARFRELLGWDEVGSSAVLLDHLLTHISRYSGEYGFMDETKGEGRFDRYSILIPAEITELVLKTGWEEPELIRRMLGNSARIVLQMASETGWGFSYGRSIGAYGETGVLQILASAAQLGGLLTPEEERLAYAYSLCCIKKMILFWYDEEMESINMWDKGRRTDGYRNKNRILGENLSLSMQVIDVIGQWESLGYDLEEADTEAGIADIQEMCSDGLYFTRFAKDQYDRGLVICRQEGHVWSLPVISGGTPYYDKDAYLPVPRENGVLEAVPDVTHHALVPRLVLEDGRELMPICFARTIETDPGDKQDGQALGRVIIRYDQMCVAGENSPQAWEPAALDGQASDARMPDDGTEKPAKDQAISAVTTYRFSKGEILREDEFFIGKDAPVKEIRLCFDTFSWGAEVMGEEVRFSSGPIQAIRTVNYGVGNPVEVNPVKVNPIKGDSDRMDFGSANSPAGDDPASRQMPDIPAVDLSMAEMKEYGKIADSFDTPHGPNRTQVSWSRPWNGEEKLCLAWKICF